MTRMPFIRAIPAIRGVEYGDEVWNPLLLPNIEVAIGSRSLGA